MIPQCELLLEGTDSSWVLCGVARKTENARFGREMLDIMVAQLGRNEGKSLLSY